MAFFDKIKQFFGVGTLDVKVQVPGYFKATDPAISGTLSIVAKSDQSVLKIELELAEKYETGRGDEKKEKRITLGSLRLSEPFSLKAGESKTVDFAVPFQMAKSSTDQLKEKGGVFGVVGKLGAFAANEKSEFSFHATVDVKGATFDPTDKVELKLVS